MRTTREGSSYSPAPNKLNLTDSGDLALIGLKVIDPAFCVDAKPTGGRSAIRPRANRSDTASTLDHRAPHTQPGSKDISTALVGGDLDVACSGSGMGGGTHGSALRMRHRSLARLTHTSCLPSVPRSALTRLRSMRLADLPT